MADDDDSADVRILNDYYAMLLVLAAGPDALSWETTRPAPIELYTPLQEAFLTRLVAGLLGSPMNLRPKSESLVRDAQSLGRTIRPCE